MKSVIHMAAECMLFEALGPDEFEAALAKFAELVRADEREACAKVAGWLWQQYKDTKDAHERNSEKPFAPSRFGFDQATVQQSQRMMNAIRARGQV